MATKSNDDYAVFVLSHGRADRVSTVKALRRGGYTGKIYIVIDNEDEQINRYYENFGRENVIVFDKRAVAQKFDCADNFSEMRAIFYARNATFDIAQQLGYTYFIEADDDYSDFRYKRLTRLDERIKSLDAIFGHMIDFCKSANIAALAFAQTGDFIGGDNSGLVKDFRPPRKAMNLFVLSTERRFDFVGTFNEDVSTYVSWGNRGLLFFTIPFLELKQRRTQENKGGMTDAYKRFGTYVKSFYAVMFSPSCVHVAMMPGVQSRLHHRISWDYAVPKILDEKWRKV